MPKEIFRQRVFIDNNNLSVRDVGKGIKIFDSLTRSIVLEENIIDVAFDLLPIIPLPRESQMRVALFIIYTLTLYFAGVVLCSNGSSHRYLDWKPSRTSLLELKGRHQPLFVVRPGVRLALPDALPLHAHGYQDLPTLMTLMLFFRCSSVKC